MKRLPESRFWRRETAERRSVASAQRDSAAPGSGLEPSPQIALDWCGAGAVNRDLMNRRDS